MVDTSATDEMAIANMVESCTHRGPDHSGIIKVTDGVFLASNRLKILDSRDEANQPITNKEKSAFLSWNGFLYNFQELKNQLISEGVIFKTRSDGEVLFQWLLLKGKEGIKHLEGMFAFVFVDINKSEILLVRDPVGMKSLYYHHHENKLICSSEALCLVHSGKVDASIDAQQVLPYWYLRTSMPTASFFKNVKELLPGQIAIFGLDGSKKEVTKFAVNVATGLNSPVPNQKIFKQCLVEAILKHFTAEVPVGMILSGGADSSLLYHIWFKETGIPLPTYTIGFDSPYRGKNSDADFAANLTKKYGGGNQEIKIGPAFFLQTWEEYLSQLDQPVGDSASYLTWLIAREAKKRVKVLVSGVGADELFGGYNRHMAFKTYLKRPNLWHGVSQFLQDMPLFSRSQKKFLKGIHKNPDRTFINFAALNPVPEKLGRVLEDHYPKSGSNYKNALAYDQAFYLVHDLLKIHDNACMAHGIEGRAPFLDWTLVALSKEMSEEQLITTTPKSWIKEILIAEGLGNIAERKKSGFGLPIKEWFLHHPGFRIKMSSAILDFGNKYGGLVPKEWQSLLKHPENHIQDHYLLLFNVFLLSEWINKNTQ
ncbi:Asparagine synthetase [Cyclobacterium qasimii M12-11B]|uniref:asparagine synthase (glutamine-hydrolyzing) n=1 Tax=Cyclobacterium qasimii M12-11B TaxID=641524 RepID=S7V535_9BACT|nr:Asparagine synthetase [Cyclobacterium qasimii M12-11B]